METYIALLRGINVSGQNKIRMADLRSCLTELGCRDVQTYIQSGNAIFRHEKMERGAMGKKIEQKILEKYGFHVSAIVMTPSGLESVISGNPYRDNPDKNPDCLYVTFLSAPPGPASIVKLESIESGPEEFSMDGRTIYLFLPHGYGRAKMNNVFLENKLNLRATTRNWKTVNKLAELTNENQAKNT